MSLLIGETNPLGGRQGTNAGTLCLLPNENQQYLDEYGWNCPLDRLSNEGMVYLGIAHLTLINLTT